jgi:sulfur carrier protein ThiS
MSIGLMKITVKRTPGNTMQEIALPNGATVADLLRQMHLRPDAYIVLQNKTPIPLDEKVTEEQELCLIQVASGG